MENRFSTKDYFTLSCSLVALIISSIGLYVNNFRVEDNMQAKFLDADYSSKVPAGDVAYLPVLIFNAGNRPGVVIRIETEFATTKDGNGKLVVQNTEQFPITLQPHDVKIINLEVPKQLNSAAKRYFYAATSDSSGLPRIYVRIEPVLRPGAFFEPIINSKLFIRFTIISMDSKSRLFAIKTPTWFSCDVDSIGSASEINREIAVFEVIPKMALYSKIPVRYIADSIP